jgi:hypothetical protein
MEFAQGKPTVSIKAPNVLVLTSREQPLSQLSTVCQFKAITPETTETRPQSQLVKGIILILIDICGLSDVQIETNQDFYFDYTS